MATDLTSVAIKDGFSQLLHCDGGLSSTETAVLDGDGTSSTLSLGTTSATIAGNLVISGNLTVSGTTTEINTQTLNVADNIVVLNNDVTGTPSQNAGIEVERGTSTNTLMRWNESTDRWQFTNDGSTYYNIPITSELGSSTFRTVTAGGNTLGASETLAFTEGSNITITESGGAVTIAATDTDRYVNAASFNTGDGVLTLTRAGSDSATVTVDLDGRFLSTLSGQRIDNLLDVGALHSGGGSGYGNISNGQFLVWNSTANAFQPGSGASYSWYLRDGDTTAVQVTDGKYVKFVEGNNLIDINFTDTDSGAVDDEFDITFTVNSSNITSVGTLTGLTTSGDISISTSSDPALTFTSAESSTDNWKIYIAGSGLKFRNTTDSNTAFELTHANNGVFTGTVTWSGGSSANANTAYSWGDHASGGYLTTLSGQTIKNLLDVHSTSPSNGQILQWNSTANYYEPATLTSSYSWYLRDGDTTAVEITSGKYVKLVEGTGIDINFTDTSSGAVDDEYDVTITNTLMTSGGTISGAVTFDASPVFSTGATGTLANRDGFTDFIGYNASYGSYIGGGASNASRYVYAGGYFYDGTSVRTLIHSGNIGSQSVDNADKLDSYHGSNYIGKNGNTYYQPNTWIDFGLSSGSGLYWSAGTGTGWHVYPKDSGAFYLRSGNSNYCQIELNANGTTRGMVYADSSNNVGFLNNSGSWAFQVKPGTNIFAYSHFLPASDGSYDLGDSTYQWRQVHSDDWFRAHGNSGLYWQTHGGGWTMTDSTWIRSYGSKYVYIDNLLSCSTLNVATSGGITTSQHDNTPLVGSKTNVVARFNGSIHLDGNNDSISFGSGTGTFLHDEELGFGWGGGIYMTDGDWVRIRNSKNVYANTGQFRGGSFRDGASGSYYLEPGTSSAHRLQTNSGYLDLGPMNSSWCHFQTDRGSFYFGTTVYVDGNIGRYGSVATSIISNLNSSEFYVGENIWSYASHSLRGNKGTWQGLIMPIHSNNPTIMFNTSANGGLYYQGSGRWAIYHNYSHNCLGIDTASTDSAYELKVNGDILATGDVVAFSDARWKTEIETISDPIDKIMDMRGVYYRELPKGDKKVSDRRKMGVIAQEILKVAPEVVTYGETNDEYAVDYSKLVGILIEGIKELKQEINELKGN